MDKLYAMRVFQEVVDRGSFIRAADHLDVAPAAITRHIAALEKELGTPLLVRTTRSLTLTERGEIYLERVRSILADVENAEAIVGSAAKAYSGVLKISVPVIYGLYFLPTLLLRFQKHFPAVQLDIMLTDDPVDFVTSGREVCLAFAEHVTHSDTVTRPFGTAHTVLCATADYLDRSATLSGIDDLTNHQCLAVKSPLTREDAWQLRTQEGALLNVPLTAAITSSTSAMVYECVLNGLGIGRIPRLLADDAINRGRMVRVLDAYECVDAELILAYPGRSYLTSKARTFIEFISANVPVST